MVRNLLVRGMLAGLFAGVLAFLVAYLIGEPALDGGIAYEDAAAAAAGEAGGEELVSRGVQSTLGLGVGVLVFGIAMGGLFALLYAFAQGRLGRLGPRGTAAVVALGAFVVGYLVPFVKYPANPPASSLDDTIGVRTGLYVVMVAASVLLAVAAVLLWRRLAERLDAWNAVLVAVAAYLVAVFVVGTLLPVIDETPADFPAAVLYDFRLSAVAVQLVLWTTIGLVFGALVAGRSRREVGAAAS